jgi:hypothetical protein
MRESQVLRPRMLAREREAIAQVIRSSTLSPRDKKLIARALIFALRPDNPGLNADTFLTNATGRVYPPINHEEEPNG